MTTFATILDPERQGTAIEIGVGTQDYYFVDFVKAGFPTLAVEPAPAEELRVTCQRLNVPLEQAAIAEKNGEVTLYLGEYEGQLNVNLNSLNPDWWGVVNPQQSEFPHQKRTLASLKVPAFTLKTLLQNRGIERLSILKVDTEGSEFGIINGLREIPPQTLPSLVQFEYGGGGDRQSQEGGWNPKYFQNTLDCLEVLKALGYEWLVLIDRDLPRPYSLALQEITNLAEIFHPLSHVGNAIACKTRHITSRINLESLCQPYLNYSHKLAQSLVNLGSSKIVHSFKYLLPYVIIHQYKIKRRPLRVLEYGPGCNTEQFIKSLVCQQIVSVEDNAGWYEKFAPIVQSAQGIDIDYRLIQVKSEEGKAYLGGHCWTESEILEYCEYPLKYGPGYFDIIFVDAGDRQDEVTIKGRTYPGCPVRNICLELAHTLLADQGVVVLHDVPGPFPTINQSLVEPIKTFSGVKSFPQVCTTVLSNSVNLDDFEEFISSFYPQRIPQDSFKPGMPSSRESSPPDPKMLDLSQLLEKHSINPQGVIHVGANEGEELKTYQKLGIKKVLFIEANPAVFQILKANLSGVPNLIGVNCAISNVNGTATLHVTSMDAASSILPLKRVKEYYPEIQETYQIPVQCKTLDTLLEELGLNPADFNLLNLDIQGAEFLALQGAKNLLQHIEAINTEVNYEELYEGTQLIDKIDELLAESDFERVATVTPYHPSWGDAFYVKKPLITLSTLGTNGRFANQIFQYGFLKLYAQTHHLRVETPQWIGQYLFGHQDPPLSKNLPEFKDISSRTQDSPILQRETPLKNVDIWGYFQFSTQYYSQYKEEFCRLFQPVLEVKQQLEPVRDRLLSQGKTIIGLHIRLKDYGFSYFFIAPLIWYKTWLAKIWPTVEQPILFIASDEPEKVLPHFAEYQPITAKSLGAELPKADFYPDFYLLSHCDILAISNSTFSFVASMLNRRGTCFMRPQLSAQSLIPYDPWNSEPILHDAKVPRKYEPACLRPLREQIADRWLSLTGEPLKLSYLSGVGIDAKMLLDKGVKNEPLTDSEREFIHRLNSEISPRLDQPKAMQSFLVAMLYRDAYQLPLPYNGAAIPKWFLSDFWQFLFATPSAFSEQREPEQYFHYLEGLVNYVHSHLFQNPHSDLWQYIALCFIQSHNFKFLSAWEGNGIKIAQKRGEILELSLKKLGQTLDYDCPPRPPSAGKIRLGILQHNFFAAKETLVTLAAFEHLDRQKFEVRLYAIALQETPLQQTCQNCAHSLVKLPQKLGEQVEKIRGDDLDILLIGSDISSHTTAIALLACHRLARVQCTGAWVATTTGLRQMDYYITGDLIAGPRFQDYYQERVVTVEGSGLCFARPQTREQPRIQPTRHRWGTSKETVIFISGATTHKIGPQIRETWAKILTAVPNSILVLYPFGAMGAKFYRTSPYDNQTLIVFQRYGIDPRRFVVIEQLKSLEELKDSLQQADLYLDAYPDTGDLSLIDPLEVGLPMVVREGEAPQTRRSSALLRELQLGEWIAQSESAYIDLAISLGTNPKQREQYRQQLHQGFPNKGPCVDTRAYSAKIGALLEKLVQSQNLNPVQGKIALRDIK
ncbi:FkbM family methyltransferase [Laspinema olomoucense]|uniref:FkbM family methyltransferase n=1 Tax=Laspinema olomoucense TaxID=3231600 RepID=UPI0021BA99B8|nr:FkbM family methyltransferase [Laspinema sp. D3d]MCT7970702.1 FkbM family methyltransferase [Laspinema sp. D3d]